MALRKRRLVRHRILRPHACRLCATARSRCGDGPWSSGAIIKAGLPAAPDAAERRDHVGVVGLLAYLKDPQAILGDRMRVNQSAAETEADGSAGSEPTRRWTGSASG